MEEESWGVLTKLQFNQLLKEFTKRFGKPIRSRRLSFSFWDHDRNEIDTRIRITDGKAEIMQKVGNWEGTHKWTRSEQHIELKPEVSDIFSAYQMFRVLIPGDNACYIYQYNNYIFKQPHFEIKLTLQIGKNDKYSFEVEATSEDVELNHVLKNLGLSELVTITSVKFWDKWNNELNLNDSNLSEKQIQDLIKKYLTSN